MENINGIESGERENMKGRKFTSGGSTFDAKVYTAAIVGSSRSCKGITKIGSVQFGLSV